LQRADATVLECRIERANMGDLAVAVPKSDLDPLSASSDRFFPIFASVE
jgi:hypothetical protein